MSPVTRIIRAIAIVGSVAGVFFAGFYITTMVAIATAPVSPDNPFAELVLRFFLFPLFDIARQLDLLMYLSFGSNDMDPVFLVVALNGVLWGLAVYFAITIISVRRRGAHKEEVAHVV
jgi:hypothetical protein